HHLNGEAALTVRRGRLRREQRAQPAIAVRRGGEVNVEAVHARRALLQRLLRGGANLVEARPARLIAEVRIADRDGDPRILFVDGAVIAGVTLAGEEQRTDAGEHREAAHQTILRDRGGAARSPGGATRSNVHE